MQRLFAVSRLPVAIGALLLLVPWFYLAWNTTMGEIVPSLRFRTKQTLAGLMQDSAPALSLDAVVAGRYQQAVSLAVGQLSPLFKPAIHWKNQIYYTLLGTAGTTRVVVGKDRQLMESGYLEEYCRRDLAAFRPRAEAWAARIRAVQDAFEARGTPFLYVITPSKVAQHPEIMPGGYRCPGSGAERARKLGVYGDILSAHVVRFVDTASPLGEAEQQAGISMFPRGGTHWNTLGAALATQQVIAATAAMRVDPPLSPLAFTWTMTQRPLGSDRDLMNILNLPHPDVRYPVPLLEYSAAGAAPECKPARVTEIGGSFLMSVNNALEKTACPPSITFWFYWDHHQFRYTSGRWEDLPVDGTVRRASLLDTDLLLLEENDAALPGAEPGRRLMEALEARLLSGSVAAGR